ncbi:MAG: carboxypeptidase regulatory-like domain-containing protein [Ectothiorhodospiraceae bacterium]|nr:carboxypeptidase regulatory-like domain-containing protein [Ectothiorhodospiraceae bacterium]
MAYQHPRAAAYGVITIGLAAPLLLSGCFGGSSGGGGGGSSSSDNDDGDTGTTQYSLEGSAINGPLANATVRIMDESGALLATVGTDPSGDYAAEGLETAGPYLIEVMDGQLNGHDYPGELTAHCEHGQHCGVSPYSTAVMKLMDRGFNAGDAVAAIGFDDPFIHGGGEHFDLDAAREALDGGTGLDGWVDDLVAWAMHESDEPPAGVTDASDEPDDPTPAPEYGPGPHEAQFTVSSVDYSAGPVSSGEITGFGYSYVETAGLFNAPGRMWYSDSGCFTLKLDGTGIADHAGRAGTHPLRFGDGQQALSDWPGRENLAPRPPGVYGHVFLDSFDRTDTLYEFQWGARLDWDGFAQMNWSGHYTHYFLFGEDTPFSSGSHGWDPEEDAPDDSFSSPLGRSLTALAGDNPYCMWREEAAAVTGDPGGHCVEETGYVGTWGTTVTTSSCYGDGMLSGSHRVEDQAGGLLLAGKYREGHPTGEWSIYRSAGVPWMDGRFDDGGNPVGEWRFYDVNGELEREITLSGYRETEFGVHLVMDGFYRQYSDAFGSSGRVLRIDGVYRENRKNGVWKEYDTRGWRTWDREYDVTTLLENGEVCTGDGSYCETVFKPWLKRTRYYGWDCGADFHYIRDTSLNIHGDTTETVCYELGGSDRSDPEKGAEISCPAACSR